MKKEKQLLQIALTEFKELPAGDNAGGFAGYPSKFYDLDEVGDVMMPGAFIATIPQFQERGFAAHSHEWEAHEAIGYITRAVEDATGLYCEVAFHSTDCAQNIRTIVKERLSAGKKVFLSIGYRVTSAVEIAPDAYADELPKYIPADKLAAVLEKASRFPFGIRLLTGVELFEFSVVTVPALRSAEVTEVKDGKEVELGEAKPPAGISFADEGDTLLDDVKSYAERAREIHNMRAKEGRTLSNANRMKLRSMCETMREMAGEMEAWLNDTEPKPKDAKEAPAEAHTEPLNLLDLLTEQSVRFEQTRANLRASGILI